MIDQIVQMKEEIAALKAALNQMVQVGIVHERDAQRGYRVNLGPDENGAPYLSPWLPHPEQSKTSAPLHLGQAVALLNPAGDPRQGVIVPGGYSGDLVSPNDDMEANVFSDAGVKVSIAAGRLWIECASGVIIRVGEMEHTISADGIMTTGGRIEHDGRNVGSDHKHSGIKPGPANTGPPV